MASVKLFGNLRNLGGKRELSVSGESLGEVLNRLVQRYPALDGVILENGQIRSHFLIIINGQIAADLHAPVAKRDRIAISPPIAGG